MNLPRSAVFIEPAGSLREALLDRKRRLEEVMPGQPYCSHPPHCTLIFGDYGDPAVWLGPLRTAVAATRAFMLATEGWLQFPHDALAGGGHTVAYRARLDPALASLQCAVADVVAPYLAGHAAGHPLAGTEPFATSLRRFGFPFVGPHWLPHFTIGSPAVAPGSPVIAEMMSGPDRHSFRVVTVSVWRVEGGRHERLDELALARGPT